MSNEEINIAGAKMAMTSPVTVLWHYMRIYAEDAYENMCLFQITLTEIFALEENWNDSYTRITIQSITSETFVEYAIQT